jgi:hypothetical protein
MEKLNNRAILKVLKRTFFIGYKSALKKIMSAVIF